MSGTQVLTVVVAAVLWLIGNVLSFHHEGAWIAAGWAIMVGTAALIGLTLGQARKDRLARR